MARPDKNTNPAAGSDKRNSAREQVRRQQAAEQKRRRLVQAAIIGGVALLAIAIVGSAVLIGMRTKGDQTPRASETLIQVNDNAKVPFAVENDYVRLGPTDAKAQIDLYADYACPHCQEFEAANNETMNSLIARGDVLVRVHNIPVIQGSTYGVRAGSAAACVAVNEPNRWAEVNAALYANHSTETDSWSGNDFADYFREMGITNSKVLDCTETNKYVSWISSNGLTATQAGVTGTPTMKINGEKTETLVGDQLVAKITEILGS